MPLRNFRPRPTPPTHPRYTIALLLTKEAERYLRNTDTGDFKSKAFREKVEIFKKIMAERKWDLNGDSIVIGKSGKLLDGRARLVACVESGMPFPTIVVTGVDDDAYVTIDAHSKRSARDILAISNNKHAAISATAWQTIASYLNAENKGEWRQQGATAIGVGEIALLDEFYRSELEHSADFVTKLKLGKYLPETVALAFHYLIRGSEEYGHLANDFMRSIAASAPQDENLGGYVVRHLSDKDTPSQITYRMAILSIAWRSHVTQEPIAYGTLRFHGKVERHGNLGPENFPYILGVAEDERIDLDFLKPKSKRQTQPRDKYDLASYGKVKVGWRLITPDDCRGFLKRNGPYGTNRPIRRKHVDTLARMMAADEWFQNGKALKFDVNGALIDGQHRCHACIAADTPFWTLVVEGLESDNFSTTDLGGKKSFAARLRARGNTSGTAINSICTTYWRLREQVIGGEPTALEAQAIYEEHQVEIEEAVDLMKRIKMRNTVDVSVAGGLYVFFCELDDAHQSTRAMYKNFVARFMTDIAIGAELKAGSPVHVLREELNTDARRAKKLFTHADKVRAIIRTWNAIVGKKGIKAKDLRQEGEKGYPAPIMPKSI